MSLVEFALTRRTTTLTLTVVLVLGGIFAFNGMGRLEDPAFTIKDAQIITPYPGASPMEVADEVTDVLSAAAQQLSQLRELKSQNLPGLSIITVTIKDQYDASTLPQVWDELRRKIGDSQDSLPPGAGPSIIHDDYGDVFGILFAVTSDGYSSRELQDYVKDLRKELQLVAGVAKVTVWGERTEAVFVEISRARMAQLGVSVQAVYETLQSRNLATPAGKVQVGTEYIRIEPTGGVTTIEDLGELFIDDPNSGKLVALKDIATIRHGYVEPPDRIMRHEGRPALAVGVSMAAGGNVVALGERIQARLKELTKDRPIGLEIERIYFQPDYVTKAIDSFVVSLLQALAIVIVVLMIFMGFSSGLLIGAVLLITVLGSFIFMQMQGIELQRISLGALIIALGMLVDNAIVVTESMMVRIQAGMEKLAAAKETVAQNIWPLLGATVIAVLAFSAIGLSDDSTGEYCGSLFWVILISLMLSWLIAITVTPLFCAMLFKAKPSAPGQMQDPYGGGLFRVYRSFLDFCLQRRFLVVGVMVVLLAGALVGFQRVDKSFFPPSTQPQFMLDYWMPEGTDIRVTSEDMAEIGQRLMADERVAYLDAFIGGGAPRFMLVYAPENSNTAYGQFIVTVKDYRVIDTMIAEYEDFLAQEYPQAQPKLKKVRLGPGRDNPIEAMFLGPDPAELRRLAEQAKAIMRRDARAKDIRHNWRQKVKLVQPVLEEAPARIAGVSRNDVAQALQTTFSGARIGVYREGDKLLPIIAQQPEAERLDVANISNALIFSPTANGYIPMGQVVSTFDVAMTDSIIFTQDRRLSITASCDVNTGVASALFEDIRPLIEAIPLKPDYALEWRGEYYDSTRAQAGLAQTLPFSLACMVLITIMLFNALRQPLIIWLIVPLAMIGVTVGLLLAGQPFGFMALLGFLSLIGMLIKNAIVLIDQIDQERRSGKPPRQAVLDSCVSRMRPVLMAASTTVLGLIPLLADAFFVAMAVTIMAGLAFATALTLIVAPVLYAIFFRIPKRQEDEASA